MWRVLIQSWSWCVTRLINKVRCWMSRKQTNMAGKLSSHICKRFWGPNILSLPEIFTWWDGHCRLPHFSTLIVASLYLLIFFLSERHVDESGAGIKLNLGTRWRRSMASFTLYRFTLYPNVCPPEPVWAWCFFCCLESNCGFPVHSQPIYWLDISKETAVSSDVLSRPEVPKML
jgi:hypothetical protein